MTALEHLWSYGTDENFLQNCEDTYGFFRHCATFPRKKLFRQRVPFHFHVFALEKAFCKLKAFFSALRDFWKNSKKSNSYLMILVGEKAVLESNAYPIGFF